MSEQSLPGSRWPGLVVVSDIHLGEDLIARAPASLQHSINRLNEEFVAFMEWLRAEARLHPHELVINGDMFDFVKISLRPDPREAYHRWQQGLSDHERTLGLDNTPDRVVWKLERILDSHRPLFVQLAEFVGEGNALHIVAGNHDREFYYHDVIVALRRALSDLYFSAHREDDTPLARDAFDTRLDFSMWFHLTGSGVYIEHGHQYDPYCSFEYLLAPRKRPEEMKIALPLTHKAIPYFVDLMGGMSTHNMEQKGILTFVRETARMGPRAAVAIVWAYVRAVSTILREAGGKNRKARQALEAEHAEERREVAQKYHLDEATVRQLDALHATPAEFSLLKMIQCFYVDRFALYFVGFVALLMEANWIDDTGSRLVSMLATGAAVLAISTYLAGLRRIDTRANLRQGASGVMAILGRRPVIFGHSHKPEVVSPYINIGSWISRAALLGEGDWGMTFAWIKDTSPGLYRWAGASTGVKLLTPTDGRASPVD